MADILEYSARPKRTFAVGVVIAAVACAVGIWAGGRYLLNKPRVKALVVQHQAAAHHDDEEEVVYEDDPVRAQKLRATGKYNTIAEVAVVRKPPDEWGQLKLPNVAKGSSSLFLHARKAVGGEDRIVNVYIPGTGEGLRVRDVQIRGTVLRPGSWTEEVSDRTHRWPRPRPLALTVRMGETLTVFAGQPDPADASHFTMRYRTTSGTGTVDGWLMRDDTVRWAVRDGPIKEAEKEAANE
jgi:hypothetical protein